MVWLGRLFLLCSEEMYVRVKHLACKGFFFFLFQIQRAASAAVTVNKTECPKRADLLGGMVQRGNDKGSTIGFASFFSQGKKESNFKSLVLVFQALLGNAGR